MGLNQRRTKRIKKIEKIRKNKKIEELLLYFGWGYFHLIIFINSSQFQKIIITSLYYF